MNTTEVNIPVSSAILKGDLSIPDNAAGLVVFSHGSGSSRLSARNKLVAELIGKHNMATLLFDLLTEKEDKVYENRFNITLLVKRLIQATEWLVKQEPLKKLPVAYFGASTGAASALRAAAYFGKSIKAVVSRGGRPDLAINELPMVTAPTLLIVGNLDEPVIELNKRALEKLTAVKELRIVQGATHLFEEPGKLLEVAAIAIEWYEKHLLKVAFH